MSGRRLPRATTAVIAAALLAAPAAQALDLGAIGQAADTVQRASAVTVGAMAAMVMNLILPRAQGDDAPAKDQVV